MEASKVGLHTNADKCNVMDGKEWNDRSHVTGAVSQHTSNNLFHILPKPTTANE